MDGQDAINRAIKLVNRLELDRQETLTRLQQEKEKVCVLRETLENECERRLNLLPSVVQAG